MFGRKKSSCSHRVGSAKFRGFALVLALVVTTPASLVGQLASPLYQLPTTSLTVHNVDGSVVHLQTVVVSTPQDMARGLMHVAHLPANLTMLFLHEPPRPASMWMKNTLISLDMWWIDTNLTIRHIANRTTPHSLDSIGFDEPVRAVVEINAGLSELLGVSPGARIEFARPSVDG